ncbi:secreted protein [Streptomyces pristinaespiralis]|nr:secreted protein [Streptomyces pristinaespiralis]
MRHMRTMRRAGVAAVLSSALVLTLSACGGDGDEGNAKGSSSSAPAGTKGSDEAGSVPESTPSAPADPIATVKGDKGVEMSVYSARRDEGGFLTLEGEVKNTGSEGFTAPVQWSGQEQSVAATGRSFAGMTLVDSQGKKRYYVLRDTDNRPLTTYAYSSFIQPGDSLTFFAQFPAPPATTTQVALQFPGFPSTTIELS